MSWQSKGLLGEQAVEEELNKLPMEDYYVFYDVMLRHGNGSTAQIDFVVVSRFGIFVLEVKNYKGIIKPSQYKSYITQVTRKGEFMYPNPLYQNKWHIATLQQYVGDKKIIPLVVFSSAYEVLLGEGFVMLNDLLSVMLAYDEVAFSRDEYNLIIRSIAANVVYDEEERAKHIKHKPE